MKITVRIYSFLMILALAFVGVSCDESSQSDPEYIFDQTAAQMAEGSYAGRFTRVQEGTVDSASNVGEMVIELCQDRDSSGLSADMVKVSLLSPDFSLDTHVSLNVCHSNADVLMFNTSTGNELQKPVVGKVSEDGSAVLRFTLTQRVGRSSKSFIYSFEGSIQE